MFYQILSIILIVGVPASAWRESLSNQESSIRAWPLYQQCPSLQASSDTAPGLIASLKGKDAQKRVKAAELLAKSCDSRAVEPLVAALKDSERSVRIAAVETLGQLGDRSTIEPLIEIATDEDWRVRAALARSLCSFQAYQASNAALNVLSNPGDRKVIDEGDLRARCAGILMVNQLHDVRFSRKAIGFLFLFLDSENQTLRHIAEETALELKNTRNGFHELVGILKQHNYPVFRRKSAYWLGKFNLEEARPALSEASIGDRDSSVQRAAREALEGMKK